MREFIRSNSGKRLGVLFAAGLVAIVLTAGVSVAVQWSLQPVGGSEVGDQLERYLTPTGEPGLPD